MSTIEEAILKKDVLVVKDGIELSLEELQCLNSIQLNTCSPNDTRITVYEYNVEDGMKRV